MWSWSVESRKKHFVLQAKGKQKEKNLFVTLKYQVFMFECGLFLDMRSSTTKYLSLLQPRATFSTNNILRNFSPVSDLLLIWFFCSINLLFLLTTWNVVLRFLLSNFSIDRDSGKKECCTKKLSTVCFGLSFAHALFSIFHLWDPFKKPLKSDFTNRYSNINFLHVSSPRWVFFKYSHNNKVVRMTF